MILRFKPAYDTNRELLQWMWRSYYASVTMLDDEVGLILMELENIPNTAVFVLSDHGDQMLEHGLFGKNVFFEDSVRLFQRLMELHKDDVELAPYPMERHGFVHSDSWLDEYKRIERLFQTRIGGSR